ncbi:TPA: hypothetical protein N0F65_001980 [Lagenidium giganteum]|uniref:PH domain-containing protein n=1 Tax=Lagenidium giganteum TaxID=4803 RepID=A0AAV2YZY4_9STRA|nr:TPA: hypothetical protein N0F65_001980 [Lagenidium giganteum]
MLSLKRNLSNSDVLTLNGYTEGFLMKRGARVKSWKQRFFTFRAGCLTYRKDDKEDSKVLRRDHIVDVFYCNGAQFGFGVKLSSGRELYLSGHSEEHVNVWYQIFEDYLMLQRKGNQLTSINAKQPKALDPIVECDCHGECDC